VDRLKGLSKPDEIFIVTNVDQQDAINAEISGMIPSENIIGEPIGRNTAPCIGLAALLLPKRHGHQPMLVLPADHLVEPLDRFESLVRSAAGYVAEHGGLLTFGIKPTRPETGYGYIHTGEEVFNDGVAQIYRARAFLEKPTVDKARVFLEDDAYYWNSGMFLWMTNYILDEISTHIPDLHAILKQIETEIGTRPLPEVLNDIYAKAPSISIDYGVMEKSSDVVVMRADFKWNDVGSWEFIRDIRRPDANGNVSVGDHVFIDASENTVVSSDRLVALLGVDDVVVVDGGDTLLVCTRDRAQEVKKIVETLRDRNRSDLV
jgi:mannose-1-phosphate guanylyltransferase